MGINTLKLKDEQYSNKETNDYHIMIIYEREKS